MQQGEQGDLSLSLSEHTSEDTGDLRIPRPDSEPVSPVDGGGDLSRGFHSEGDEARAGENDQVPSESEGEARSEGVDGPNGTHSEEQADEAPKDDPAHPMNPPIIIQSPTLTEGERLQDGQSSESEISAREVHSGRHARHQRNESVPLKRYDVESAAGSSRHPSASLGRVEEGHDADDEHRFHSSPRMQSTSETEDAGLDFVDVRLDAEVDHRSPYGPGAHHASRSAVEIRQDSISSNSDAARKAAKEAEKREARTEIQHSLHRRRRSTSEDGSVSSHGSRTPRRSVEGRFMGRRSRPTSRAASPEPNGMHRSSSTSLAVPHALEGAAMAAGMTMVVAGDDGEVNCVEIRADEVPGPAAEEQREGEEGVQREGVTTSEEHPSLEAEAPPETSSAVEEGDAEKESVSVGIPGTASANSLNDAADKEKSKKRRESSNKPSALEQHVSRTRMTTLPPKPKQEDVKHLHDFEAMMKLSRELEIKKQQEVEERRQLKDVELQENMKVWERDILPSWTRARREVKLRKLWWKGIPPSIRGRLWAMACGNNQMLPRNLFSKASLEAQKSRDEGKFPAGELQALEADIASTLPSLKLFQRETGALHDDLFAVLCAFVVVRMDRAQGRTSLEEEEKSNKVGDANVLFYVPGAASLAAMLLTNLTPSETLIALLNLVAERPWLHALYAPSPPPSKTATADPAAGFERVLDTLLADQMPKVYANMQARGVRPSAYVTRWIKTLFVPYLPFDLVARLWDCILLDEGDALLFRSAIALVSLLSARLYVPDKGELISILRGNNRAALSVWYRFRHDTSAPLPSPLALSPGGEGGEDRERQLPSVEAPAEVVPLDNIYGGQYDINESNLFETLEEQSSWWKDSTLERLLDRELVT